MRLAPFTQSLTEPLLSPLVTAITGVFGGGFNPLNLFAANEPGYLYDLDDLSTLFLDSAGTTPATVNGLVGLVLDKSKGLALGAELVTNGDFSNGTTGWTANFLSASVVGGRVELTRTGIGQSFYTSISTVAGKWYEINFEYQNGSTSGGIYIGTAVGFADVLATTPLSSPTEKLQKILFLATSATSVVHFYLLANGTYYVDDVSIKELPGNHAYQTTTGSKPILRGTPTGANLVTNGDFASGTGWTLQSGITISGGKLNFATATNDRAEQTISMSSGRVYRVTLNVTSYTSGTPYVTIGGSSVVYIPSPSTIGQKVLYVTAGSTDAIFRVYGGVFGVGGTCSIDNIEVHDVSAGSVTAPYALQYDGVDDFLQTASVDFTATDKVTVCHGVRKLSDAATAMLVELTVNSSSTAGAFSVRAPQGVAATYGASSGGTITGAGLTASATSYASPNTAVVSYFAAISTDTSTLRVNGTQEPNVSADQGTGNYANAALYFGRRAGTSLPYNGLEYSSVCIGRLLTAAELANTERWVARKTGVTL